jgi:hypothetical protein
MLPESASKRLCAYCGSEGSLRSILDRNRPTETEAGNRRQSVRRGLHLLRLRPQRLDLRNRIRPVDGLLAHGKIVGTALYIHSPAFKFGAEHGLRHGNAIGGQLLFEPLAPKDKPRLLRHSF